MLYGALEVTLQTCYSALYSVYSFIIIIITKLVREMM